MLCHLKSVYGGWDDSQVEGGVPVLEPGMPVSSFDTFRQLAADVLESIVHLFQRLHLVRKRQR